MKVGSAEKLPCVGSYDVPRAYHHNPHWFSKAQRRAGTLVQPGSERWRRRITERAYRLSKLGPPVKPEETDYWREEEYRLLRYVDVSNGCRFWEVVNELAKGDPDYGYRVAQQRFTALRQRLINEGKLVRVSKGYNLMISDSGERRFRELAGLSPDRKLPKASHGAATYETQGTCGLVW